MAITGIGNNYNNVYDSTYAAQKNETSKKTDMKEAAPAQAGNTKKAGTDSVSGYYSYLQKNYECVKNGSVAISGSYLKECAKNPEKAKELEENLSFFKEGYESGKKKRTGQCKRYWGKVSELFRKLEYRQYRKYNDGGVHNSNFG